MKQLLSVIVIGGLLGCATSRRAESPRPVSQRPRSAPPLSPKICASLIERSETVSDSNPSAAEPIAKKAITACRAAAVKTARPYMVLAVCANRAGRYRDVIAWSEKALLQEPGLALAYMDMCSAYSQLKKYDDAVATCKKGLTNKNEWSGKLNYNIGLALFQKAVDADAYNETLKAVPYFKESKRLEPAIAENDFYLATIEESVKMNLAAAIVLFDASCKQGYQLSCEGLDRSKKAAAGAN